MDWKKIWEVAKMPVAFLIGLNILSLLLNLFVPQTALLLAALVGIIGLITYIYVGYKAATNKMDLVNAGLVGAVTAFVVGVVGNILGLIFGMLTAGPNAPAFLLTIGFMVVGLVIGVVIGFVLAVIGAVIAGFISKK